MFFNASKLQNLNCILQLHVRLHMLIVELRSDLKRLNLTSSVAAIMPLFYFKVICILLLFI